MGTPLKDWNIQINYGIKTGFNDAFIISAEKRNEILANCQTEEERSRTAELIRPILRGRDIKRYSYEWVGLYIIYIPWHFPLQFDTTITGASEKAEEAFKEQYPAVYTHMLQYKEPLSKRNKAETGIRYEWYAMQRWGANYWEDFLKPKIIYPNMTKYMPFVYDNKAYYTNQKCFIITGQSLAYLTAFFNSSLFKFCFRESFPELQGGTREMSKIFFDRIPVLQVNDEDNEKFVELVYDIQREYSKEKAIQIDERLFNLYNLTTEEREAIGFVDII
ncbi:TaqI-like C-terminal specificity domain-containing protein [uncultured Bacteroides sp.]|uniref:TaqI-like C-terminal specificity domain-containing protein n=1 Tax=uncultured Bacteroides sp. TaxID=162156 RepID=UPI0026085C35|nr:TaqI-like C-terminal specificity domain-containing protein [uncultured Bacteroides sp.]